jgi:DNA-binding transcriptional LysR family regulator
VNLEYLMTYLQVVRLGSFSEASKRLSISQPAVSFQIQKLERDLGVRLIDRRQKPVTLTDAGKRLLRFAKAVKEEDTRLRIDLDRLRAEVTGDLAIVASTIPGEVLLPPILGEFKALHPAAGLQVDVSDSVTAIERVRSGAYEVGFCGIAPSGKDMESFKLAEDEIVLIVFPGHPLARRDRVSLPELHGEMLILREASSGTQRNLESFLAKAGLDISKWSPRLVLGTSQAVVAAVEAGIGVAFVSNLAIKKSVALGLVKQVVIEGPKLSRSFYCVYRKERVVSRLLSEFIAFVEARASQN